MDNRQSGLLGGIAGHVVRLVGVCAAVLNDCGQIFGMQGAFGYPVGVSAWPLKPLSQLCDEPRADNVDCSCSMRKTQNVLLILLDDDTCCICAEGFRSLPTSIRTFVLLRGVS